MAMSKGKGKVSGKASKENETEQTQHFKVINHDIATNLIEPLGKGPVSVRDVSLSVSRANDFWTVDDEEEVEFTFPSHPKRFRGNSGVSLAPAASDAFEDIESLVGRDENLGNNKDFWREVGSSCEEEVVSGVEEAQESLSSPLQESYAFTTNSEEPRLEDFISDAGTTSVPSPELFQPHFEIKRLCFRDAEGKLALTAGGSTHVHKPAHLRASKSTRRLMKRVIRRKSGVWEMVCPSVAVAEFMLL